MHDHSHHHHHTVSGVRLFWTIVLNISITVGQFIGGILSGSMALLSDAVHNLSDVISLIVSYTANRLAHKKATTDKTFGYKRAEIIAAFINAISLILIAFWLIYESIQRIVTPNEIEEQTVIYLSLVAIVGNGLSVLLLKNQQGNNLNIRSAYVHLFSDLLGQCRRARWSDCYSAIRLATHRPHSQYFNIDLPHISRVPTTQRLYQILMLYTPHEVDLKAVIETVHALDHVKKLHHIHIWKLNDTEIHLEAHIDLHKDLNISDFTLLQQDIEALLLERFGINHITLQPEFQKKDPKEFIVQD
jgi:cobalt-zinc-cadmium efflux system protein